VVVVGSAFIGVRWALVLVGAIGMDRGPRLGLVQRARIGGLAIEGWVRLREGLTGVVGVGEGGTGALGLLVETLGVHVSLVGLSVEARYLVAEVLLSGNGIELAGPGCLVGCRPRVGLGEIMPCFRVSELGDEVRGNAFERRRSSRGGWGLLGEGSLVAPLGGGGTSVRVVGHVADDRAVVPLAVLELAGRAAIPRSVVGAGPAVRGGDIPRAAVGASPRGVVPIGGVGVAVIVGAGVAVVSAGVITITIRVSTTRATTIRAVAAPVRGTVVGVVVILVGTLGTVGGIVLVVGLGSVLVILTLLVGPLTLAAAVPTSRAEDAALGGLSRGEKVNVGVGLQVLVVRFEGEVVHLPARMDSTTFVVFVLVRCAFGVSFEAVGGVLNEVSLEVTPVPGEVTLTGKGAVRDSFTDVVAEGEVVFGGGGVRELEGVVGVVSGGNKVEHALIAAH
jgi:hypothetical protein